MPSEPDQPRTAEPGPAPSGSVGSPPTLLTMPRTERRVMWVGLPLAGVVLSLLLPMLARWLLDVSNGLPLKPVFWFLGEIDDWWKVLTSAAVGALVGIGAAAAAAKRTVTVSVGDDDVVVVMGAGDGDRRRTVARAEVEAIFLDGRNIVVQGADSRRLISARLDASRPAIAQAFRERGYRWLEKDPNDGEYRRWRPEGDELPAEVNAVLAARAAALRKRSTAEAHDLAEALHRLGYDVREDGTRQDWRRLKG
jgi:hypothetical protein